MDKFIPREKLGRKARKALDARRRATWSFPPTTRRVESKKQYNRKRKSRECPYEGGAGFFAQGKMNTIGMLLCRSAPQEGNAGNA